MTIALVGAGALAVVGCRPAEDWRELRWPEAQLSARFPCKPDQERAPAAQVGVMAQCPSDGILYALAWQRFPSPMAAQTGLAAIPDRWKAQAVDGEGRLPPGALAWKGSGRWVAGDATRRVHLMVWAQGLTVFQATVVAPADAAPSGVRASQFFDQIQRLP